jgi:predicted pyridoxine 5'-phosphate oxidase superfamily flavin-nucleotide-binding protein
MPDTLTTIADLEKLYGQPVEAAIVKEVDRITPHYRAYVDAVYFQCARALVRSELWNPARHVDPKSLPSAGQILAALSHDRVGGERYDREWPGRALQTMW